MSKEQMDKLKGKKNVHEMWKKGMSTWEEYRKIIRACRDKNTKALLELNIVEEVKGNKKGFLSISKVKRRPGKMRVPY